MISPKSVIVEFGRKRIGADVGQLSFSLRSDKMIELNDNELNIFKNMLIQVIQHAEQEQMIRMIKKADPVKTEPVGQLE